MIPVVTRAEDLARMVKSMRIAQMRSTNYPTEENKQCAAEWETRVDFAWLKILGNE